MGFHPEACKRAVFFTQNSGLEMATQWIMEHIGDSDFNDPFVPPGTDAGPKSNDSFSPDPTGLEMIQSMGFSVAQATKALKETGNNIERAADWIFSHEMEMNAMDVEEFGLPAAEAPKTAPAATGQPCSTDESSSKKN